MVCGIAPTLSRSSEVRLWLHTSAAIVTGKLGCSSDSAQARALPTTGLPVKVIGIRSELISEGFDLAEMNRPTAARPSAVFSD